MGGPGHSGVLTHRPQAQSPLSPLLVRVLLNFLVVAGLVVQQRAWSPWEVGGGRLGETLGVSLGKSWTRESGKGSFSGSRAVQRALHPLFRKINQNLKLTLEEADRNSLKVSEYRPPPSEGPREGLGQAALSHLPWSGSSLPLGGGE